jgi:hypothetical protein
MALNSVTEQWAQSGQNWLPNTFECFILILVPVLLASFLVLLRGV